MRHPVDSCNFFDVNVVCSTAYGCYIRITLVFASTRDIFTTFAVMSGWLLLASSVVQYQGKIIKQKQVNIMRGAPKADAFVML